MRTFDPSLGLFSTFEGEHRGPNETRASTAPPSPSHQNKQTNPPPASLPYSLSLLSSLSLFQSHALDSPFSTRNQTRTQWPPSLPPPRYVPAPTHCPFVHVEADHVSPHVEEARVDRRQGSRLEGSGRQGPRQEGRQEGPGRRRRQEAQAQDPQGDLLVLHLQGPQAGPPGHGYLEQGHAHPQLVRQRHL
jgi:hypothetical protein